MFLQAEIADVLVKSGGLDPDDSVSALFCERYYINVDGSGEHTSLVMVRMVSGDLAPAGNGKNDSFAVSVKRKKAFARRFISQALRRNGVVSVKLFEASVKGAFFDI